MYQTLNKFQFLQRIISMNQRISQKKKFITSSFHKCYHLYNRSYNPFMTIYLASTPKSMFRLSKLGFLPSIFIDLKYDVTIVASYMFGTASSRQWRTKGGWIRVHKEIYWQSASIWSLSRPTSVISARISPIILRKNHKCTHLVRPSNSWTFLLINLCAPDDNHKPRGYRSRKIILWSMGCHICS